MSSNCSTCSTAKVSGVAPRPYGVSQTISNVAHVGSLACLRPVCTCMCVRAYMYVPVYGSCVCAYGGGGICNVSQCMREIVHALCVRVCAWFACVSWIVCVSVWSQSLYLQLFNHQSPSHTPRPPRTRTHARSKQCAPFLPQERLSSAAPTASASPSPVSTTSRPRWPPCLGAWVGCSRGP